ncbi:SpoIIE family protein phosphatase [Gudongella sp. DL1XJH-153]|uniref:SpoIIE family protein phosphatase n=1 Tax=Gudongella sp. DL1XJH-153 TaxID=3409804 RepID=UPI003BB7F68B
MTIPYFVEISHNSLNKFGEELCGDHVEILETDDRIIVVLADGLGSGVKANILSTLTSKIMATMLQKGEGLIETIDTITKTLPVCQVRNIGYSTFTVLEVDKSLHARIIEFDNPPVFLIRDHQLLNPKKIKLESSGKNLLVTDFSLQLEDVITVCSDGVIHAGVGNILNHGWQWHHVGEFLAKQSIASAEILNRRLINTCRDLYDNKPGDDTSAVTVKIRKPIWTHIFAGPPVRTTDDSNAVSMFMKQSGRKIVCGGTAANIVARELGRSVNTTLDYIDPSIPPTASIKGIDLVTEGVLTLNMALNELRFLNHNMEEPVFKKADGVSKLLQIILRDSSHIKFWIGRTINSAHKSCPEFPDNLVIKERIIQEIMEELNLFGKRVSFEYTD